MVTPLCCTMVSLPLVSHFKESAKGMGQVQLCGWATSIPLIESLCCHGQLATFTSPISHHQASLVGFLYVDDCDLLAFGLPKITHEHIISALHKNILLWQGSLKASGSSLSLKNAPGASFPINVAATAGSFAMTSLLQP